MPDRVEGLTALAAEVDRRTLAFVGGQGKSGTTWVQLLLDAHPEVSAAGEGLLAEVLGPACYQLAAHYNERLRANNARFAELEDYPGFDAGDADQLATAALLLQLGKLIRRKPAARILAERTPSTIAHLREMVALFPAARFVHVIRDPRDVAVSLWWHAQRIGDRSLSARYSGPDALAADLTPRWADLIRGARAAAAASSAAMLELRYEDLLDAPDETARTLFDFIGADSGPQTLQAALMAADFRTLTGRAHGEEDRGSHFRSGRAGAWREALEAAPNLAERDRALLLELGYRPD
jgi:hypothetical protein